MKRKVQRQNKFNPAMIFLTTGEAARIVGCRADAIMNRVARNYIEPAARAGRFARALCLWSEDQLPEIRRAIVEHSAAGRTKTGGEGPVV